MCDFTHHDCWVPRVSQHRYGRWVRDSVDATEFHIDPRVKYHQSGLGAYEHEDLLQANVRIVLWFGTEAFRAFHALRGDTHLSR
jgi:hypothetical protein